MRRIEGVEALLGYCDFNVSASAIINEIIIQVTARKRFRL